MGSQYLVANNDSPEIITVQFEFKLEIHKTFILIRFCSRFLTRQWHNGWKLTKLGALNEGAE